MKTLKNLTLAILAAGTMAACSTTRTGTGSGGSTGTSGTGTDTASTGSSGTTGTSGTSGTTRDSSTSSTGTTGVGGNVSGSLNTGSSIGSYTGSNEASGNATTSTVNTSGSVTSTGNTNGTMDSATGISGTQSAGAGSTTTLSGTGSNSISGTGTSTDRSLDNRNSTASPAMGITLGNKKASAYGSNKTTGSTNTSIWNSSAADTSSASGFITTAAQSGMKEIELSRLAQTKANNPEVRSFAVMMVKDHSMHYQQLASLARTKGVTVPGNMTAVGAGSNTMGSLSGTGTIGNQKSTSSSGSMNTNSSNPGSNTGITGNQGLGTSGNTSSTTNAAGTNNTSTNATNPTLGTQGNNPSNQNMGTSMGHDMSSMGSTGSSNYSTDVSSLQNLSGAEFDRRYMQMMVQDHEQAVNLFTTASQSSDAKIRAFAVKSLPKLRAHLYDAKQISNRLTR